MSLCQIISLRLSMLPHVGSSLSLNGRRVDQVACAFIGSLGAIYTSVLVVHLALALFALVAIESGSQNLGRTYVALLACAVILDIAWFTLFTYEIRFANQDTSIGKFSAFSLKLVLWMQIFGFAARVLSSFLWAKMYRLGASSNEDALYQPIDFEERARSVDFTPDTSPGHLRDSSLSDEVLAGSIYNPAYYASLFQSSQGLYSEVKIDEDGGISDGVSSPFAIRVVTNHEGTPSSDLPQSAESNFRSPS